MVIKAVFEEIMTFKKSIFCTLCFHSCVRRKLLTTMNDRLIHYELQGAA